MRQWLRRFRRPSIEEFAAEVEAHLAHETDEHIERGLPPDEARHAALRRFGNVTRHLERFREASPSFWAETVWMDLRYACRSLRRSSALFGAAVSSLALGIGGTTAIVSLLDTTVLRPLPYPRDEQLTMVAWEDRAHSGRLTPAWVNTKDVREYTTLDVFQQAAAFNAASVFVDELERPGLTLGIDCAFFDVLGVTAELGRTPKPADCEPSAPPVVVLSHELWESYFASDRNVLGRTVRLRTNNTQDGRPSRSLLTVIGVMPPRVSIWREQTWVPTGIAGDRPGRAYSVVLGRMHDGVRLAEAESQVSTVAARVARTNRSPGGLPDASPGPRVALERLRKLTIQSYETTMYALAAGAGCVLLIVCLNVGTLLLARGTGRQTELAVRASLGASRGRIVRQFLVESAFLTILAAVIGTALAAIGMAPVSRLALATEQFAPQAHIRINAVALLVAAGMTTTLALALGMFPALYALHRDPGRRLIAGERTTEGVSGRRWRATFVAAQIAIGLPILCATAALVRNVSALDQIAARYHPDHLVALWLNETALNTARYASEESRRQLWRDFDSAIATVPGVVTAARTFPPLLSRTAHVRVQPPQASDNAEANVQLRLVSQNFLATVGIPVVTGRGFQAEDSAPGRRVALVSRSFARIYIGDGNPVGRLVHVDRSPEWLTFVSAAPWEVVGVAEDAQLPDAATGSLDPVPSVYVLDFWLSDPYRQAVVRTDIPATAVLQNLRGAIARVDPDVLSQAVVLQDEIDREWRAWPRVMRGVALSFAIVSLVLVVGGIYGVLSYSIVQLSREIGIRMALGAAPWQIAGDVIGRGVVWALVGVTAGVALTVPLHRLIQTRVWGLAVFDVPLLTSIAGLVIVVSVITSWIPARRAMRVDPIEVLRAE